MHPTPRPRDSAAALHQPAAKRQNQGETACFSLSSSDLHTLPAASVEGHVDQSDKPANLELGGSAEDENRSGDSQEATDEEGSEDSRESYPDPLIEMDDDLDRTSLNRWLDKCRREAEVPEMDYD